jgi:serine/threonine protein kinase/Tfp pilus assembly protein PilF
VPESSLIGRTVAHYKILSKLGEGAMGEVYLAEDAKLGRQVALKVPPADLAADPQRLARYEREARAVAALNHPNIVTLHSIEESDGVRFLTMELVQGQNLAQMLPGEGLPLDRLLELAIPITDALSAAHDTGIVHRDLKPENIMVNDQGQVKILDFGLAKLRETDAASLDQTLTQEGMVFGTVPYMSPEQVQGQAADTRSDIFSLGVILYEMATGQRPFKGESSAHVISSILRDTPISVTDLKADLPNHLGRLVRHCLEKDPERRYQTAKDVRYDLLELRREAEASPAPPRVAAPPTPEAQAVQPAPPSTVPPEPAPKRLSPATMLLAVMGLLIAAGVLYFTLGRESDPGPSPTRQPARSGKTSIAVLPFANLSADPENEFFADGLTEELIQALAKVERLDVPARTSVFALKGKELDIKDVGERLGVETLLEGSVRRAGNQLRITAQLVNVEDGFELWSKTYDRTMEDAFAIQDEISKNIVEALRVTLSPGEQQMTVAVAPADARAYDYYLRGRGYFRQRTRKTFLLAREMFEKAIEIDPNYAPAYAGLADCFTEFYRNYDSSEETLAGADEASSKAVALAPGLAQAHASRGYALGVQKRYEEAEREFDVAIRLNPTIPEPFYYFGTVAFSQGRIEKAGELFEKAVEVAPDDLRALRLLPQVYRSLGRQEDVRRSNERVVVLAERHLELNPTDAQALVRGANALADLGEPERGLEWVNRVMETGTDDALLLYNAGCFYSLAGKADEAFDALQRSFEAGHLDHEWMRHDSDLDPIRDDPRFEELLAAMEAELAA